jgi:hypothetical protein
MYASVKNLVGRSLGLASVNAALAPMFQAARVEPAR